VWTPIVDRQPLTGTENNKKSFNPVMFRQRNITFRTNFFNALYWTIEQSSDLCILVTSQTATPFNELGSHFLLLFTCKRSWKYDVKHKAEYQQNISVCVLSADFHEPYEQETMTKAKKSKRVEIRPCARHEVIWGSGVIAPFNLISCIK
jgi:hypothetical protein